jgi:hypothetical protein
MRDFLSSIEGEYTRYKALAERAIDQVRDDELFRTASGDDNSIAVLVRHLAGNFRSRFTDFLTADGEKPWRDRDSEFVERTQTRAELMAAWQEGWRVLFAALAGLSDANLPEQVTIRGQHVAVHDALHRSLAHASYHVGQIVYMAKALRGEAWTTLSIPRGQSAAYNAAPVGERPQDHAAKLRQGPGRA